MSSNTAGPRNKGHPPKSHFQYKYSTPSEQLLQFSKTLGFEVPKNLKHEHLDYMFKDEKSARFVKMLMSRMKPENVLTEDEVEQYDQLVKDGMILYGQNLERAVTHRTALDKKKTDDDRTEALRTEELQRLIDLRQQEIIEIRKQDQVLRNIRDKKHKSEEARRALRSQHQKELDTLDLAIEVSRKRVRDKLEKLKKTKAAVLRRLEDNKDGVRKFMVDWDWKSFLEHEDKLITLTEEFIVDHVPNLIIESEGYNELCEEENKVKQAIYDYVAEFERLKHSIVYEECRKLKFSSELELEEASLRLMNKDEDGIGSSKRGMDMQQLEDKLDTSNEDQRYILEKEYAETLQIVRENALQEVDSRFNSLVESRNRAKRRLDTFISRIYEILESQKVRIDVVRHLMYKEIQHQTDLGSDLENLESRLAGLNLNGLTKLANGGGTNVSSNHGEGREFQFQSFQDSFNTLTTSGSHSKTANEFSIDTLENVEHEERLKKVSRQINHMKTKLEKLKTANTPCNEIHMLKLRTQEKNALLDTLQEEHSTSKNVAEKMQLLEAIQSALENHRRQASQF